MVTMVGMFRLIWQVLDSAGRLPPRPPLIAIG